jgi:hypothetical protein
VVIFAAVLFEECGEDHQLRVEIVWEIVAGIDEVVLVYAVVGSESLQQLKSFSYLFANVLDHFLMQLRSFEQIVLSLLEQLRELGFGQKVNIDLCDHSQYLDCLHSGLIQISASMEQLDRIFRGDPLIVREKDVVHAVWVDHVSHKHLTRDFSGVEPVF